MKKVNTYDILSILVIVVFVIVLMRRFDIFPIFVDIYYHASVVLSFDKAGGIVLWDFWEFAPGGRPHLYPPLLHCCMLFLSEFADYISVAKFTSFVMFPLSQITVWFFSREILSRKTAFYAVLILSSSLEYFRLQAITSAAALVLVILPFAFYAFEKGKYTACTVLFALSLYTHVSMGPLALLSLGLYGIIRREKMRNAFKVIVISLVLYAPWGVHVLTNMGSVSASSPSSTFSLMIFPWVLGAGGMYICVKRKKEFLIPVSILLCMIPIWFSYPGRFTGHSILPLAILSGIALSDLDEKIGKTRNKRAVFVVGSLLVLSLAAPTIGIREDQRGILPPLKSIQQNAPQNVSQSVLQNIPRNTSQNTPQNLSQNLPQQNIQPQREVPQRQQTRSPIRLASLLVSLPSMPSDSYLTEDNLKMAEIIKKNSRENEIVFIPQGIMGCFITATTGRPQIFGMWQEVASDYDPDPQSASLFVMPKERRAPAQLVKIGETGKWVIYRAPQKKMVDVPDPVLGKVVVYLLMAAGAGVLFYDLLKRRQH